MATEGGFYWRAAFIRRQLLSGTAFIRGRLLFAVGLYSRATCIVGRLLFEDGFYSSAAFIRGRL